MAHAMNYDVYKSMDALEAARGTRPGHFFAQLKYAELHYRLRALMRAEEETLKALDLAGNAWELSLARKQLQEIRRLMREGTQKPEWTKPLTAPALWLLVDDGDALRWRCTGNEENGVCSSARRFWRLVSAGSRRAAVAVAAGIGGAALILALRTRHGEVTPRRCRPILPRC